MASGHLSKELRKKYGKRTFGLRSGDTVSIMNGKFRKKTGKIESVIPKKNRIYIEGITIQKAAGTKTKVPIQASNVIIIDLNLEDKWRKKMLEKTKTNAVKKESGKIKPAAKSKNQESKL